MMKIEDKGVAKCDTIGVQSTTLIQGNGSKMSVRGQEHCTDSVHCFIEDGKIVDHLWVDDILLPTSEETAVYYIGDSKYYKHSTPVGENSR